MSNLNIDTWVNRSTKSDDYDLHALIEPDTSDYVLGRTFGKIAATRGIARVHVQWSGWEDSELAREYSAAQRESGAPVTYDGIVTYVRHARRWRSVSVYGTRSAIETAQNIVAAVQHPDRHADHDHASCVASAARLGVPAAYAHTPESYLSA